MFFWENKIKLDYGYTILNEGILTYKSAYKLLKEITDKGLYGTSLYKFPLILSINLDTITDTIENPLRNMTPHGYFIKYDTAKKIYIHAMLILNTGSGEPFYMGTGAEFPGGLYADTLESEYEDGLSKLINHLIYKGYRSIVGYINITGILFINNHDNADISDEYIKIVNEKLNF